MAVNVTRFKEDLDRLINEGTLLEYSMLKSIQGGEDFVASFKKALGERADNLLKKIPNFKEGYEAWYSESLALLKQLLPDRVGNFVSFYEKPKSRKDITHSNYVIQDYLQGLRVTRGWNKEVLVDSSSALPQFQQQLAIIKAAKTRFDSSLFEIRQLVQADLFDSELEAAHELSKNKFYRAAGAIAGVVLEKHLQQVCEDRSIIVPKKNPTISDLNELLKANSIIDISQWRYITFLGDIRNLCDHNKEKEPTAAEVDDLMNGTEKIIKTIS